MVDSTIVGISLLSFLFFVLGMVVAIRMYGQKGILISLKRLFIVPIVFSSVALWFVIPGSLIEHLRFLFLHLFLYWSLCFSYVIGLLGLPLTSLRIQLLLSIVRLGGKGINYRDLTEQYSKTIVVKQRLYRLTTSHEITEDNKMYSLRSSRSYFMLHTYVLVFLLWLYKPIQKKI